MFLEGRYFFNGDGNESFKVKQEMHKTFKFSSPAKKMSRRENNLEEKITRSYK
jgi:hypothetical protein